MQNVILLLIVCALLGVGFQLKQLTRKVKELKMTIEEYKAEVGRLGEQLVKVLNEILNMIQVGQTVTQEDVDKLNAAKAAAQALDDLNPDA